VTVSLWVSGVIMIAGSVLLVATRQYIARGGVGEVRLRLEDLHRQVVAWQAAHDHQVASLDRRMRDVEVAAARAEEEARIVSVQMAELTQSLVRRLEQVEQG
jgi:hypothetical protein